MKKTKQFFYLVITLIPLFFFISCSDDDNPSEGPTLDERLVGNWTLIKITVPLANMELTPEEAGMMMTGVASSDGKMELTTIDSSGTLVESGTWSTKSGTLTLVFEDETVTMGYSVSSNIITVNTPLEIEEGVELPSILDFRID